MEGIDHVLEKELDVLVAGSGLRVTQVRFAGVGTRAGAGSPGRGGSDLILTDDEIKIITDNKGDLPEKSGEVKGLVGEINFIEGIHCGPRGMKKPPSKNERKKSGARYTIKIGDTPANTCVVRFRTDIAPPPHTHTV